MLQNPKAKGIHPPIQQASTSAALASAAAAVDYYAILLHPTLASPIQLWVGEVDVRGASSNRLLEKVI